MERMTNIQPKNESNLNNKIFNLSFFKVRASRLREQITHLNRKEEVIKDCALINEKSEH